MARTVATGTRTRGRPPRQSKPVAEAGPGAGASVVEPTAGSATARSYSPLLQPKTAVVVIHGIGEQTPLETLRGFVETVYRRDRSLASLKPNETGLLNISIVPDDVTGSAELRRITTFNDGPQKRTDFFEFYWADIMDGTPVEMVTGWIQALLLRSPFRLPGPLKVKLAWGILLLLAAIVLVAGAIATYPGLGQAIADWGPMQRFGARLMGHWNHLAGGFIMISGFSLAWQVMRANGLLRQVSIGFPLAMLFIGLVLWLMPAGLATSIPFWAGAITAGIAYLMYALVTPFAGDVVRYVRATPRTVEKRRLVRERGMALLEALHRRRLDDTQAAEFTQVDSERSPPLYDRIVLVGHSLGTIIAYDILQLFWEKYGPTHHQHWWYANPIIQKALQDSDSMVQAVWGTPSGPFDAAKFSASQSVLYEQFSKAPPNWRISDLITLGSPLTHAEFLLADSKAEIEEGCTERKFATSPPHPDVKIDSQDTMLRLAPGADARKTEGEAARVPHFATQFSAVRWTNIYDESNNPLAGDLISGSLTELFGPGVVEHPVVMKRLGLPKFLQRVFTHTQYWTWHDSYEAAAVDIENDDVNDPIETRRALLWTNLPEHIRLLREALRLGT